MGGLIRTEKIRGPSHVVATRMSVERARMYSSISGVILKGVDLEVIKFLNFQPHRYSFLQAVLGKNQLLKAFPVLLSRYLFQVSSASYLDLFGPNHRGTFHSRFLGIRQE